MSSLSWIILFLFSRELANVAMVPNALAFKIAPIIINKELAASCATDIGPASPTFNALIRQ